MSLLFAGSRTAAGYVDAVGDAARFEWPSILAFDDNYLYVTEWGDPLRTTTKGCRVRRIDPFTREVTTAATFNPAAYENPWGITRHPGSGNWYVCCPGLGDVGKSAGRIFVFDPDWNLLRNLRIQDGATNYAIWYACPSPDESVIYAAGHRIQTNPTFGSARFLILDGPTGNVLTTINADTVAGVGSIHSVGGVCIIESTVYWNIAKGGVEGIYTTGLAPTSPADFTLLVSTFSLLPEEAALVTSLRQLHVRGSNANIIEFASGDTFFNSPFAGTGSHWYDLAADTFTDAADAFPDTHAGAVAGTQLCHEQDYLTAFDTPFVTRCLLRSHAGFYMFEADGPSAVAHTIEIYGNFPSVCTACDFEYPYRWPQFAPTLLAGSQAATIISLLAHRDRELAARLTQCGEEFDYPHQWEDIAPAFLDPDRRPQAAALLEQNDAALELHLLYRTCAFPFEYPYRWNELIGGLFDVEHPDNQRHAVAMLEERDRLLEDRLGESP